MNLNKRLNPKSVLICNLELDWGQKKPLCRDEVTNNPHSLMRHMIKKHKWQGIPELALRECKTMHDKKEKLNLYNKNPEEWFLDNQFIWSHIRSYHFRQRTSKGLRDLRSLVRV